MFYLQAVLKKSHIMYTRACTFLKQHSAHRPVQYLILRVAETHSVKSYTVPSSLGHGKTGDSGETITTMWKEMCFGQLNRSLIAMLHKEEHAAIL